MNAAFYDIYKSYEENYRLGPTLKPSKQPSIKVKQSFKFLGYDINFPFGIPAGPLLNNKFMKTAFKMGFDVSTYKTVRSREFPCHPYPNILFVNAPKELHPDKTLQLTAFKDYNESIEKINITNSFGVPSMSPSIWQEDVKKSLEFVKDGQLLILSFMGTVRQDQTKEEFIADFADCAKLSKETGAKVLEVNLSCPNLGAEGLVCYDLETTKKICQAIRKKIGNAPLVLKIGYFKNHESLEGLAKIVNEYANGVAAINTLQTEIVDKNNNQALPGNMRLKSGVCGPCIKWAGSEMVETLNDIRQKNNYKFSIIGVGGVTTPNDFIKYRKAGADLVQSATGAMWNPNLAYEIKNNIG